MSFGVTSTGFVAETLTDIKADLEQAFKAEFGDGIDVSPQSVWGQIIGIMAERLADLWDADEGIYTSWTPEGAIGQSLDNICALTGTVRNPATYSTGLIGLVGTNGTSIPSGTVFAVGALGNRFATVTTVTIATVSAWSGTHVYTAGSLVSQGGNVYYTPLGGTSGSSGPATSLTDGSVVWVLLGAGSAAVVTPVQATSTGALVAPAGTLTYIATPVAGLTAALNPSDIIPGTSTETDAALRIRREAELHQSGTSTLDGLRAKVLALAGVTGCSIFDNPGDVVDGNGVPAHSFETLVSGLTYDVPTLRQTIWANKPLGIRAYGSSPGTVIDSQGFSQSVSYSVPTAVNAYVTYNLVVDASLWNTGSVAALQAAAVAYGLTTYVLGKDIVAAALNSVAFNIPGVLDAACLIGTSVSPTTSVTIPVTARQYGSLDTSRIVVNVSFGVP